jgi:putative phosphoribosyl transferase
MFKDRYDAGMQLAKKLEKYRDDPNVIVFAIPRGGVIVASVVCDLLNLPMDIVVTKKIGAPFNEELAIGAVGPTGGKFLNHETIRMLGVSKGYIEKEAKHKMQEVRGRLKKYRGSDKYNALSGKKALLIDDGIATGYTVMAAINFLTELDPENIILGTPVIAPDTLTEIQRQLDEVVYLISKEPFFAVGQFYEIFSQVSDAEVMKVLNRPSL